VTADHTPERLSAEERERGRPSEYSVKLWFHERDIERILASHLAALRAECDVLREQTARVKALADRADVEKNHFGETGYAFTADIRAILHPQDPDQERTSG
jgi:hypothetical protein